MRKIKNIHLAQLFIQLKFTSLPKRLRYLNSTEKLLETIEPYKEYPFDFVCYKITNYHPKGLPEELINGSELAEDLRIFISRLSGQVAQPVSRQNQKVYSVEGLAKYLGVSTKTISRWREKGLLARKFIFEDGTKRLGFLQSNLDKFLAKNPELVNKAKTFGRLTEKEKDLIIKQARKLVSEKNLSRYQIINIIAEQTKRVHETIRCILIDFENSHPEKRIFKNSSGVIDLATATEIYKLYKQGVAVDKLISRFNRSKTSIYRIINRRRAKALLAQKIEFVPSDEFLQPDTKEIIFAESLVNFKTNQTKTTESLKLAGGSLSEYLQTLKDVNPLSRDHEAELFRRYNYLKYLASRARTNVKPAIVSSAKLKEIENYLAEAEEIKNIIIESNLQLVVGVARKHIATGVGLQDLISEGNFSLIRAVEKFDYTRGFRFTTFASWIISKDFARKISAKSALLDKTKAEALANVQEDLRIAEESGVADFERARYSLVQAIKNELDQREQHIILNHFGLIGTTVKKQTKTLKEIGDDLGLTKERVRQIELIALQKLKQSLSSEEFEMLTG